MRICRACRNYVLLKDGNAKRVEPEWLSAKGLCPTCQKKKGALREARQHEGKQIA